MLLLLHGDAGSWDEIAIAVAAFVVLWVAVKLAGRKSSDDEDEDELGVTEAEGHAEADGRADAEGVPEAAVEPIQESARRPARR